MNNDIKTPVEARFPAVTSSDTALSQFSRELLPVTAAAVKANQVLIQEVLKEVMHEGVHYGKIPGTKNLALFKSGAEKILATFRIGVLIDVLDLGDADLRRYRVTVRGIHQTTGLIIGEGVGECSTDEDKYKWRSAVCHEEFSETLEERRRSKWKKGWGDNPASQVQQVRTEPADLSNTCLKMAKKRALVDLSLTATAASDVFEQDAGDGVTSTQAHDKAIEPKVSNSNMNKCATDPQLGLLRGRLENSGKDELWLCMELKVDSIESIKMGDVNAALKLIAAAESA